MRSSLTSNQYWRGIMRQAGKNERMLKRAGFKWVSHYPDGPYQSGYELKRFRFKGVQELFLPAAVVMHAHRRALISIIADWRHA